MPRIAWGQVPESKQWEFDWGRCPVCSCLLGMSDRTVGITEYDLHERCYKAYKLEVERGQAKISGNGQVEAGKESVN